MLSYLFFSCCVLFTAASSLSALEQQTEKKVALIFGVSGQDGSYLAEFLLNKNYEVHGVSRDGKAPQLPCDAYHNSLVTLYAADICHPTAILRLISAIRPDEIYNLAAQSNVGASFYLPLETAQVNAISTLHMLEAVKLLSQEKPVKFFQAASSELFESTAQSPQQEKTPFHPVSPYGVAKLYSYWITVNYREAYGIFGCNGILFNHESPLRPKAFITRKITSGASRYKQGLQDVLYVGNLNAKRDWGYAKDYVEAMWLMLQQDRPDDYVIATGEAHSVRECIELAFLEVGVDIEWHGEGVNEYGIDKSNGNVIVKVDSKFYRPCDADVRLGNPEKAKHILQWTPKTSFEELIKMMVQTEFTQVL